MIRIVGLAAGMVSVGLFLGVVQGDDKQGGDKQGGDKQGGDQKPVIITNVDDKGKEKEDGGKVKLAKGQKLMVKLPGNPTTGFTWGIEKNDNDVLEPKGKPEYVRSKEGGKIGGGGTFIFDLTALKAGTSDLEFGYKRPFEKGKEPAKTFKVKVVVE